MKGKLYEILYAENKELKESKFIRDRYIDKWKERFGYHRNVSFDTVLTDLYKLKYGEDPK